MLRHFRSFRPTHSDSNLLAEPQPVIDWNNNCRRIGWKEHSTKEPREIQLVETIGLFKIDQWGRLRGDVSGPDKRSVVALFSINFHSRYPDDYTCGPTIATDGESYAVCELDNNQYRIIKDHGWNLDRSHYERFKSLILAD